MPAGTIKCLGGPDITTTIMLTGTAENRQIVHNNYSTRTRIGHQLIITTLICFALTGCHKSQQRELSSTDPITVFRRDSIYSYDFDKEPLSSDISKLHTPAFQQCSITDSTMRTVLMKNRHYYDLLFYTKVPNAKHDLYTVYGYYDLYTDLLLVSLEGNQVLDYTLIASFLGDAEDFRSVTSHFKDDNEVLIEEVVGKLIFSNPDNTYIRSEPKVLSTVKSILRIDAQGKFEITLIN